jgi:hypothetical protein
MQLMFYEKNLQSMLRHTLYFVAQNSFQKDSTTHSPTTFRDADELYWIFKESDPVV